MKKKQKGSVSVYLILTLSVLLSLFVTVIEGARQNAMQMQFECAFNLGIYSVFGEYNRELFDRYHVLFIDTSYQTGSPCVKNTNKHFSYYVSENLSKKDIAYPIRDFTKSFLEDTEITNVSYATDDHNSVFEKQAITYMKEKYGLDYLEDLKKSLKIAEENQFFTRDIDSEISANHSLIEELKKKGKETGELDEEGNPITEEIEFENPADAINTSRPSGVLLLVMQSDDLVSAASISGREKVSDSTPRFQGEGLKGRDKVSFGETLLFDGYIKEHCQSYLSELSEDALNYQLEYILGGKDTDEENLKYVVNRLILMREISNVTYLFSDPVKNGEALALATEVCSLVGVPALIEPVKISLLFAWGYMESLYDVKCLLQGKRVVLMKDETNWHYSLEGMLSGAVDEIEGQKEGLNYEEYLGLMLSVMPKQTKLNRMMDMVQLNIQNTKNNKRFHLDACIDRAHCSADIASKYGYSRHYEKTYFYLDL